MRIIVTNDDGIHAPGLKVLQKIAHELSDDVWTVAPETDQSGVSHSLSLHDPLRLRQVGDREFAVKGTPSDCVIMGLRKVLADKAPDLVLSGVNRGQNVAEDVIYSGTIAGAMEGAILGLPAIAMSQAFPPGQRDKTPWDCAATHAASLVRKLLDDGLDEGTLVNINFPACQPDEVKGVAVTMQGRRGLDVLRLDERMDGRNNPYFWLTPTRGTPQLANGTDLKALAEHKISVTPLQLNMTHEPTMTRFARLFG
ncbi:broad specificity 5'(3')-nucleotidase and polyphosphatase [Hyphomicrobiales bacterium]|nr:broad specificity 5'(3')-nucleotidase and polyphosphatase [Hyphomicrobiales bacterium]CAH1665515.1 broad specificity 5'(3')-nucleotidase and polyphosphatase [Hyphomicrobiales bacterium]